MKKIYWTAFIYVILGLALGVFYREFTKIHEFVGHTQLAVLHTHALALGTFFFLIVFLLAHVTEITSAKSFSYWMVAYNVGLAGLLATMLVRGMGQVLAWELSGWNHVAGLSHVIIAVAFIWFFILLGKSIKTKKA